MKGFDMNNKVGIVILNYNTPENACALAKQFVQFQNINKVVIVDNCSSDQSVVYIQNEFQNNLKEKFFFIESECNGGYAKGNNIGLKYLVESVHCDICFIANPDIRITEDNFNLILDCFENYLDYAVLTCSRTFADGEKLRQYWDLPNYKQVILESFILFRKLYKKYDYLEIETSEDVIDIDVAPGAFWGIRSEVLKELNFLDEGTFLYYEENCFAQKLKKIKKKEGLVKNAIYTTFKDQSSTMKIKYNGLAYQYILESKRYYTYKYLCQNKIMSLFASIFFKLSELEYNIWNRIRKNLWRNN